MLLVEFDFIFVEVVGDIVVVGFLWLIVGCLVVVVVCFCVGWVMVFCVIGVLVFFEVEIVVGVVGNVDVWLLFMFWDKVFICFWVWESVLDILSGNLICWVGVLVEDCGVVLVGVGEIGGILIFCGWVLFFMLLVLCLLVVLFVISGWVLLLLVSEDELDRLMFCVVFIFGFCCDVLCFVGVFRVELMVIIINNSIKMLILIIICWCEIVSLGLVEDLWVCVGWWLLLFGFRLFFGFKLFI